MSEAPEIIYLQWIPEKTWYDDTVTWCEDSINDDDVEYIKASTATRRLGLLRRWDEYRKGRKRPCPFCFEINHTGYCELAEELKS